MYASKNCGDCLWPRASTQRRRRHSSWLISMNKPRSKLAGGSWKRRKPSTIVIWHVRRAAATARWNDRQSVACGTS